MLLQISHLHVITVRFPDVLVGVRLLVIVVHGRTRRRGSAEAGLLEGLDVALRRTHRQERVKHSNDDLQRFRLEPGIEGKRPKTYRNHQRSFKWRLDKE